MKFNSVVAASALVASMVSAVPVVNKRAISWVTVMETDYVTKTVTATAVPATQTASVNVMSAQGAQKMSSIYHPRPASAPSAPPANKPSPSPSAPAPQAPAPQAPAPAPAPSQDKAPAPQAPAPAPQAPAPAPQAPAPAPAPASSSSSAPSGQTFTGEMTHYDVGLGSCGVTSTSSDKIVALAVGQMNNPANPNANPLCNSPITIEYNGKTVQAKVVDTCQACKVGDLDMSDSLFQEFSDLGAGRLGGVKWWFNN